MRDMYARTYNTEENLRGEYSSGLTLIAVRILKLIVAAADIIDMPP